MSSIGKGAARENTSQQRVQGLDTGWTVFSYLISGLVGYGAIGWLLSRVTHIQLFFPLAMIVGIGVSTGYVIYRYGRQGAAEAPPRTDGQTDRRARTDGQAR